MGRGRRYALTELSGWGIHRSEGNLDLGQVT